MDAALSDCPTTIALLVWSNFAGNGFQIDQKSDSYASRVRLNWLNAKSTLAMLSCLVKESRFRGLTTL